jgi:hypothetical protein
MLHLYCSLQPVAVLKFHLEGNLYCLSVSRWCYCYRSDSNLVVSLEAAAVTSLRTNALRLLNERLEQCTNRMRMLMLSQNWMSHSWSLQVDRSDGRS